MQEKVLIVDDESLVADTLSIIFSKSGYACRTAYCGEKAIADAESFLPDLLICDVCIPDRDGLDVANEVCRVAPECRVLMFTGQYDNLRRVTSHFAKSKRQATVLTKPILPDDLLDHAKRILALPAKKQKPAAN